MQYRYVNRIAQEAGIGLRGIKVSIVRDPELIGKGVYGYAYPKGNRLSLFPDAFTNKETLIRTLSHERTHIFQFNTHGKSIVESKAISMERAAYGIEDTFWQYYNLSNYN